MDVHHLRVFVSVFKHRSFSRASKELKLTQPTISSHIMTLEKELDCILFDRTGRAVIPTREAEALYLHAIEVVEKLEGIRDALRGLHREVAGELVVGASTIPGTYILPQLAARFRREFPQITFEIRLGDTREIARLVASHELLVGLVGARTAEPYLEYESFVEDELVVIAPPELLAADTVSLSKLRTLPLLLREEGSGTRKVMESYLLQAGLPVKKLNVVGMLGSTDAVKEAVKAGLGVSVVSRLAVRDELGSGRLRIARIRGMKLKREFFIVTHRRRTLPAPYRLLVERVREQAKTAPEHGRRF